MQLSEAIRLGAMLKPQGFESLINDGHSCALGAALDAVGKLRGETSAEEMAMWDDLRERWPLIASAPPPCPACPEDPLRFCEEFGDVVWHLNDEHAWTREQIADWVATIEAGLPEAREATPSPSVATVPEGKAEKKSIDPWAIDVLSVS